MARAGQTFFAILLLGTAPIISARTVYAENYNNQGYAQAYGYPFDAPRMQQDTQEYGYQNGALQIQQEMEAEDQQYDMETLQHGRTMGEIQELYAMKQAEETCPGRQIKTLSRPYVQGSICPVTESQCGWVKFSVMENFVRYFQRYYGADPQLNAHIRLCKRGDDLCYENVHNDCSRLPYPIIRTPISVPTPLGSTTVMVIIQEPPQVCLFISKHKCPELL